MEHYAANTHHWLEVGDVIKGHDLLKRRRSFHKATEANTVH